MEDRSANASTVEITAATKRLADLFRELRSEESKRSQAIGTEGKQCVDTVVSGYEAQIEALLGEIERLDC